jgi:competence protein ComEA
VNRSRALCALALLAVMAGAAARLGWPSHAPQLSCPASDIRWTPSVAGSAVAGCDASAPAEAGPPGASLTVGQRIDLNRASEKELQLLPGVGPALARAILEARAHFGKFSTWDDVDAISGVGPAKLRRLQQSASLGP